MDYNKGGGSLPLARTRLLATPSPKAPALKSGSGAGGENLTFSN